MPWIRDLLGLPPAALVALALALALALTALALVVRGRRQTSFPLVNDYPGDWSRQKARSAYQKHAYSLLVHGFHAFSNQPFRIITALGDRVILPPLWIDWLRSHPHLDHQAQVAAEFFGDYPGFEGIGAFNDPAHVLIDTIKRRMTTITPTMLTSFQRECEAVLEELGASDEWHAIDWPRVCNRFVASLSSSIFVGPRLGHDPEWLDLIQSYTVNLFHAARLLRSWPAPLRPLVHWFLPECRVLRVQMARARAILPYFIPDERVPDEAHTVFHWLIHTPCDMAAIQLGLAAGGLHTTSQLLQQCLLDLAVSATDRPDLIAALRAEFERVLDETYGELLPSTLPKLDLLDACLKESQRLKPQTLVNLERMATRAVVLPNGQTLPRGTQVAIPTPPMFERAPHYDPARHLPPTTASRLVASDAAHYAFGRGRAVCPGRFLVAAQLKTVLALLLARYDVRIADLERERRSEKQPRGRVDGGRVRWRALGFEMLTECEVGVEVRRRRRDARSS